jgi:hypothetical protein
MRTLPTLLALLVGLVAGEANSQPQASTEGGRPSPHNTTVNGVELWQMRFPTLDACVQARTDARPAWPKFLAEAICRETQYGNAVPPGYYEQGHCEIRQKDRKMSGVLKWSGRDAWPLYCSNTQAEKYAHDNIKLR